jgi:hypothetical protein
MDHNLGLSDAQDVAEYLKRDATKRATSLPYKIVRDEIVGRSVKRFFVYKLFLMISFIV